LIIRPVFTKDRGNQRYLLPGWAELVCGEHGAEKIRGDRAILVEGSDPVEAREDSTADPCVKRRGDAEIGWLAQNLNSQRDLAGSQQLFEALARTVVHDEHVG
jgi:hypothetical protein